MHLPNGAQLFIGEASTPSDVLKITSLKAVGNKHDEIEVKFTDAINNKLRVGDFVMFTSCVWGKLVNVVVQVNELSATDSTNKTIVVKGFNASDPHSFPTVVESAQGGNGTLLKYDRWIEIPCVQDLAQDGGEQQFYTYQCLSDDREQQLPTFKSAVNVTYTFAWDFENQINELLREKDSSGEVVPMRMYVPRAREMRMWSAVLSFNDIPQTTMNEMETVSLSASIKGRFVSVRAG